MNNDEKLIVGIESGINKKYNTPFTVLYTQCIFDDFATNNRNAKGMKAETTYIRGSIQCNVGDVVKYKYQPGFNNEAVVYDVDILMFVK